MKRFVVLLSLLSMLVGAPAWAGSLEGVKMPDKVKVGDQELVLNGMGLREKFFVNVYVGGLYLPSKTKSGKDAIEQDVTKRIVMHFVHDVEKAKLIETLKESIKKSPDSKTALAKFDQMAGWMKDVKEGDEIILDYVPGKGTTFSLNGKANGTIEGVDFMRAIWGVFLGDNPASDDLKKGMLGK